MDLPSPRVQLDQAVPELYDELRRIAAERLRDENHGHTLQTTALVHEAYLRLAKQHSAEWLERTRILSAAAEFMRRILVDHARHRQAAKRPPPGFRIDLSDPAAPDGKPDDVDLVALDEALRQLETVNARQARTVVLRYFGGLSIEETAKELQTSVATVNRDWKVARAWLFRQLQQ